MPGPAVKLCAVHLALAATLSAAPAFAADYYAGKTDFDTPLGKGTMQFGVQQGLSMGSGFGFGPGNLGTMNGSRAGRADFERMVTPDGLR